MKYQRSVVLALGVAVGALGCGPPRASTRPPASSTEGAPNWDYRIAKVLTSTSYEFVSQDVWDASRESIAQLQGQGAEVFCYFSAGTLETENLSRQNINTALFGSAVLSDDTFAAKMKAFLTMNTSETVPTRDGSHEVTADGLALRPVVAAPLPGFENERIYDIAGFPGKPGHAVLKTIVKTHLQRARDLGCDAVEPDNVDTMLVERSGITSADQYAYNTWIAEEAHTLGLRIWLKNDLDQVADGKEGPGLARLFDGLINEQCLTQGNCDLARPFAALGKPIWVREYDIASCSSLLSNPLVKDLRLNVSSSPYSNGGRDGSPDANAEPPQCGTSFVRSKRRQGGPIQAK